MNRPLRLAAALFLPSFVVVFAVVRAAWLAYLRTLSESQLHLRVFEHSTRVALALWGGCLVLAVLLALGLAQLLGWLHARRHHKAPG